MFPQLKDSLAFLLPILQPVFNITSAVPGPTVDLGYATYQGAFDSATNITEFLGSQSYEPRPVLVWFHGGGYASGSASGLLGTDIWDGKYPLTRAKGGLVVVVVQYRLGMYGFLAGKEVHAAGGANAGIQDQQFSLRWVQEHIHKFGGNPADVTIWGLSAGAGSVYQHIVANGGQTTPALFNTAITSSTFLPPQYAVDDIICETMFEEALKQTNCDNLDCLRKVDTFTLQRLNANMGVSTLAGTYTFTPVVDGTLIQQAPAKALAQGKVNGKHLLSVTNSNEGQLFVNVFSTEDDTLDTAFYLRNAWPKLKDDELARALELYADLAPIDKASAIYADVVFVCPTYRLMRAFDKPYRAQFAVDNALHGFDAGFYFPDLDNLFQRTYSNSVFEDAFASAFTNFALAKDPNVKVAEDVTPAWAPWSDDTPFEMVFNKTADGAPDVLSFWQTIAPSVGQ
ncbi:Alpha/Beta hydrolase protein [Schizophyllum fasciatum]